MSDKESTADSIITVAKSSLLGSDRTSIAAAVCNTQILECITFFYYSLRLYPRIWQCVKCNKKYNLKRYEIGYIRTIYFF